MRIPRGRGAAACAAPYRRARPGPPAWAADAETAWLGPGRRHDGRL